MEFGVEMEEIKEYGVNNVIGLLIKRELEKRKQLVKSVPEKYREVVKRLLRHTRQLKAIRGSVSWGWFTVYNSDPSHRKVLKSGEFLIKSANKSLPEVIPQSYIIERKKFEKLVRVPAGEIALLKATARLDAKFEVIGILIYPMSAYLLEVKSSGGIEVIWELEDKLNANR